MGDLVCEGVCEGDVMVENVVCEGGMVVENGRREIWEGRV